MVGRLIEGARRPVGAVTESIAPESEGSVARNQRLPDTLYPDDAARMLLRLAANDSRRCTAQRWIVDGGWM